MNHSDTRTFLFLRRRDDRALPSLHAIFHRDDEKSLWRLDGHDSTGGLNGRAIPQEAVQGNMLPHLYTFFWAAVTVLSSPSTYARLRAVHSLEDFGGSSNLI